jgi:hypothetical protein
MSFFSLISAYRSIWAIISAGFLVLLIGLVFLGNQIVNEVERQESKI